MEVTLIDDDGLSLFLSRRMLEKFSPLIKIREFMDAEIALDYFKGSESTFQEPHIIFLDLNLGKMDGLEFVISLIDINERFRMVSICILTSSSDNDEKMKVMEIENVIEFISKPITEQKLFKAITKCLLLNG